MREYRFGDGERFWEEDGYIYFETHKKPDYSGPQVLATDKFDYRYVYGGAIYRVACEIVWKARKGGEK